MSNHSAAIRPAPGEPIVTIKSSQQVGDGIAAEAFRAAATDEAARQGKVERHAKLREKAAKRETETATTEDDLPPVQEDLESILIELTDGRQVLLQPPTAGTTNYKTAVLLGSQDVNNAMLRDLARAMIHVKTIDEATPPELNNKVDFIKFMDKLGPEGVDAVTWAVNTTWPYFSVETLKIVKKNVRT